MTTNKLRRELELLKLRSGRGDCPGCGYPSYKGAEVRTIVRITRGPEDDIEPTPPERCPVCRRPKLVIRMRGLSEKSRGSYEKSPS